MMITRMAAICLILMFLLSGCGSATESGGKNTPVASTISQQASSPTEMTAPTPTPAAEPTSAPTPSPAVDMQQPANPVELLSEEDQKIIKEKFTFTATPQTDKKINDGRVKDGVYAADTLPTSYGHKAYVVLTVKNSQVVEVVFYQWRQKDNTYKDETYGKEYGTQFGEDTFEKAQISVEGGKVYPVKLIESQDLNEVDAVSGATYTMQLFKTATNVALRKGEK